MRIANVFGLADDRILSYNDRAFRTPESKPFQSLRSNVMQLFQQPKAIPPVSSLANLGVNKQFVLALDAPGVPSDLLSFPLSWSTSNKIAVACGCDVYYQDLDTREITHLCNTDPPIRVIDWAKQDSNVLALGAERGTLHLWDATDSTLVRDWSDEKRIGVYSFSWHDEVLAVGERPGSIGLYDVRVPQTIAKLGGHKVPVYALEWSPDGKYLASGDASGVVQIWDAAACKSLGEGSKKGGRMKHGALVKVISTSFPHRSRIHRKFQALAWCPWKPELLATGTLSPDGMIRVWNTLETIDKSTSPTHTIPMRTAITSLHWSPHCKELLSTHGDSWQDGTSGLKKHPTEVSNSITVHSYPSYSRLLSLTAHTSGIGHSCLSPDGTKIFTICPAEEAMKMWKVWGASDQEDESMGGGSIFNGSKLVIR